MKRYLIYSVIVVFFSACAPFQVSDDDIELIGGEKPASFDVVIGGIRSTPPDQIDDDFPARVREVAVLREELTGDARNRAHIVIQFESYLTAQNRERLDRLGVSVLSRINSSTWTASVDQKAAAILLTTKGVRWADIYPVDAKLSSDIRREEPFEWQKRDRGRTAYSVLFHSDIKPREVERLRESSIGAVLEDYDARAFPIVLVVTVVIDSADLDALAAADIVRWIEPAPPPAVDFNLLNTQPLSNVDDVQVAPYGLSGTGIAVGIWEAGDVIRSTHKDLTPRVVIEAGQTASQDNHAAHVAGTVGSSGINFPNTEGMAPTVTIASWDLGSDTMEMANAANSPGGAGDPTPIDVSNHSNGFDRGWAGNGQSFSASGFTRFGQYGNTAQALDNVVVGTDLIALRAAGNDRNDTWDNVTVIAGAPNGTRDCTQGGLGIDADCITDSATAKNIITVGSMAGGGAISGFSNFGPTDDGRIKPDIVAQGSNVLSLGNANDDHTWTTSGTSMATPAVTGVAALILEDANNLSIAMTAAGMKALLLQTAQDVAGIGQATVGPDYATGYGIADAQAAVDLLRLPAGPGLVQESLSATGMAGAYSHPFYVPAGEAELHVTLAWTDPAGDPTTPSGLQLVNDLDLRLIAPDGVTTTTPWSLNPAAPGTAAVRNGGDDTINNVEQVSVLAPAAGVWFAQVTAKAGSLGAGSQDFAMAGPLTPASGPIASTKADIVLVMDKSGSMGLSAATVGMTKMDALQDAVAEFLDFIELVGGHNVGLVKFHTNVEPFVPPFDLQPLTDLNVGAAKTAIGGMSPGDWTNIIGGVTTATGQLASAASTNPTDVVFLFSDGRHNRPLGSNVADIDAIIDSDTRFYSIGFGTDVDSTILPGIAANHNGLHLEEQTLSPAQLSKLFLTIGGLTVDEDVVIDPDYPLSPGESGSQAIYASTNDHALTFALHWNIKSEKQMSARLIGPDRECRIVDADHTGYETRAGQRYKLIRIDLPYHCRTTGKWMHQGQWMVRVQNTGTVGDTVKIMVLADTALTLDTSARVKGRDAFLQASFRRNSKRVCKGVNMSAIFTPRIQSTRDSEKQDAQRDNRLIRNALNQDAKFKIDPAYQRLKIAEPKKVSLYDHGRNGDRRAGDCIYGTRVRLPAGSGFHQVRIVSSLGKGAQTITREAYQSVYVK